MERVILDPTLLAKLSGLSEQVELCDENGHRVGYFLPTAERDASWYAEEGLGISQQELERRMADPGGRTTAEVLRRLEGMGAP